MSRRSSVRGWDLSMASATDLGDGNKDEEQMRADHRHRAILADRQGRLLGPSAGSTSSGSARAATFLARNHPIRRR